MALTKYDILEFYQEGLLGARELGVKIGNPDGSLEFHSIEREIPDEMNPNEHPVGDRALTVYVRENHENTNLGDIEIRNTGLFQGGLSSVWLSIYCVEVNSLGVIRKRRRTNTTNGDNTIPL